VGRPNLRGQSVRPLREVSSVLALVDGIRRSDEVFEVGGSYRLCELCVDTVVDVPCHDRESAILPDGGCLRLSPGWDPASPVVVDINTAAPIAANKMAIRLMLKDLPCSLYRPATLINAPTLATGDEFPMNSWPTPETPLQAKFAEIHFPDVG
jgi:hypothetical protein